MITYNSGLSGSLGAPSKQAPWNDPSRGELQTVVVPVVTMASVLASVRSSLNIVYLKTDVQGFDATVLRAAGPALRRVQYIQSEVWLSGVYSYDGPRNDYCVDVLPLMLAHGYEPTALTAASGSEQYLAHYMNKSQEEVKHSRFFFAGGGAAAAQQYCERERSMVGGDVKRRAGLREADAFFRLATASSAEAPILLHKQFRGEGHHAGHHWHRA